VIAVVVFTENTCQIPLNNRARRTSKTKGKSKPHGAKLGFEEKLWQAADKMRGHMDPAEHQHVVLGDRRPHAGVKLRQLQVGWLPSSFGPVILQHILG
jgi:hypothetical protein